MLILAVFYMQFCHQKEVLIENNFDACFSYEKIIKIYNYQEDEK